MATIKKASVVYEADASQTVYAFPFEYLRKAFIKVEDIHTDITELTQGTDYTVTDKQITLTTAIPLGHTIKIYRETSTDALVEWQDASVLKSADLTLQEVQLLHLAEETADKVFDTGMSTSYTNTKVWEGDFKRITNLLDPIEGGDAVTLRYIKANQSSLLNQLTSTGATQNASIVSTGDTQNARLTSTGDTQNSRVTSTGDSYVSKITTTGTEQNDKVTATGNTYVASIQSNGDTQNTRVTNTADSYITTMTSLKDATNTKATEASNNAALSKAWAESSSSPDGNSSSKSSKSWASVAEGYKNNASTYATNAATSATNANTYMGNAKTYATNASSSASSASGYMSKASTYASNASSSATSASTYATDAATSARSAASSATAAAESEANAKTWDPTQYAKKERGVPAGVVMYTASTTAPKGWLTCDGSAVSRTNYDELFEAIGTTYGAGDGSTTFNLPNLMNRYAEGGKSVGTKKEAGLPNITGSFKLAGLDVGGIDDTNGAFTVIKTPGRIVAPVEGNIYEGSGYGYIDASLSNPIYGASDTVQPSSLVLLPIIKY